MVRFTRKKDSEIRKIYNNDEFCGVIGTVKDLTQTGIVEIEGNADPNAWLVVFSDASRARVMNEWDSLENAKLYVKSYFNTHDDVTSALRYVFKR